MEHAVIFTFPNSDALAGARACGGCVGAVAFAFPEQLAPGAAVTVV